MAFGVSHRFWYVVFSSSLNSRNFNFFPCFFDDQPVIEQCFVHSLWVWILTVVSFVVEVWFYSIVIWYNTGDYFNFLKFVLLCVPKYSLFWRKLKAEKNVYCMLVRWNTLYMSIMSIWSNVHGSSEVSLVIFCVDDLSTGNNGVFRSPIITGLYLCF
jgi:hypothetical protein